MPFNGGIFGFNLQTGALTFETSNPNYVGYRFEVQLNGKTSPNGQETSFYFFITVLNGCSGITITPGSVHPVDPLVFPLWEYTSYNGFDYAQLSPAGVENESWYNCGILYYTLVDAVTN